MRVMMSYRFDRWPRMFTVTDKSDYWTDGDGVEDWFAGWSIYGDGRAAIW